MPPKPKPSNGPNAGAAPSPEQSNLTPAREAALSAQAKALGTNTLVFPGKAARRIAWSAKIQVAAARDAKDLVNTPFHDDEPRITKQEIELQREQIQFLRLCQTRWRAMRVGARKASQSFGAPAEEAKKHRATMLKFFGQIYRNDADGKKWVADVRAGSGDADLVQDVSDILERCTLHTKAIAAAPRGEGEAFARLTKLHPVLDQLLSEKSLGKEARAARRLRDAAYTLVMSTERRLRGAAEYWYDEADPDRFKDYVAFPASSSSASEEEEAEEEELAEEDVALGEDAAADDEGALDDEEAGDEEVEVKETKAKETKAKETKAKDTKAKAPAAPKQKAKPA